MGFVAARGVFNTADMLSLFLALTMLPLAEVSDLMWQGNRFPKRS